MDFIVSNRIDPSKYRHFISLGNRCITSMALDQLGLRKEAYPFDFVNTQPAWILDYLKDPESFIPVREKMVYDKVNDVIRNPQGVGFLHHDMGAGFETTRQTFLRRFVRLQSVFKSGEKILLVYTSEADVYNEMNSRYNDNYGELQKIVTHLETTYPGIDVEVLAIHTNRVYPSTSQFHNYTIFVDEQYMSNNLETHVPEVFNPYRAKILQFLKEIFNVNGHLGLQKGL